MKNKKVMIGIISVVILIIAIIVGIIIINMPKEKPEEVLNTYFSYINSPPFKFSIDFSSEISYNAFREIL